MDMTELIPIDFDVERLVQDSNLDVFGGTKNAFHHLVFYRKKNGYNEVNQFFVHRFEIANRLMHLLDNGGKSKFKLIGTDIEICLESDFNKNDGLNGTKESEFLMFISCDGIELCFPLKGTFGNGMIQDSKILAKLHKESGTKSFRKKAVKFILGEFDEEKGYSFSNEDLIIAVFELNISKNRKYWAPAAEIRKILAIQEVDTLQPPSHMVENLLSTLPALVHKSTCDCGNDACFFDLLKTAYDQFFTEEDILTNGEVDETKVENEFSKVWINLSSKQRIALTFLDEEFGNTPLLNLYLCTPGCSIEEYLFKMTYPYQPDSEDDIFVRSTAFLAFWWLNYTKTSV